MTYSTTFIIRTLSAFVIACAMAVIATPPAAAQTAKKLNCSGCVKSKQLKNGGVKGKDLKDSTVTGSKIAPDSIDGSKIADGAVGSADLGSDAVTDVKIADDAVGSSEVASDSIPATDLSNETGANFVGFNETLALSSTDVTVRTVTVTAPSSGQVIVNVSGTFNFNDADDDSIRCSITTGTTIDFDAAILGADIGNTVDLMPFAGVRGFSVGAGSNTFNFVCDEFEGTTFVTDTQMVAFFVPTSY